MRKRRDFFVCFGDLSMSLKVLLKEAKGVYRGHVRSKLACMCRKQCESCSGGETKGGDCRHRMGKFPRLGGHRHQEERRHSHLKSCSDLFSFRHLFSSLRELSQEQVEVISPRNHLLFTPMLASSALGTVNQRSICQPVRPLTAKKNATYYESSVVGVDKEKKQVQCKTLGGQEYNLPYDKLVIGIGFQPNDFNISGVKEHALFMKETADATRFKDHVPWCSESMFV